MGTSTRHATVDMGFNRKMCGLVGVTNPMLTLAYQITRGCERAEGRVEHFPHTTEYAGGSPEMRKETDGEKSGVTRTPMQIRTTSSVV